ncbi:MAG: septum formation initiator family protein [Paracoccaceae bacterium]|nr:septum formation initiator family protein [Paracoccaceae bacterium]MDE2914847.1 septum formation initiator family protein [Paracoccaceae bacterium]
MTSREGIASFLGTAAFCIAALLTASYFAWAAVKGDYGRIKRVQVDASTVEAGRKLAELIEERQALENKVRRLSDDYLDLDLLDERSRAILGYARSDEIIIR